MVETDLTNRPLGTITAYYQDRLTGLAVAHLAEAGIARKLHKSNEEGILTETARVRLNQVGELRQAFLNLQAQIDQALPPRDTDLENFLRSLINDPFYKKIIVSTLVEEQKILLSKTAAKPEGTATPIAAENTDPINPPKLNDHRIRDLVPNQLAIARAAFNLSSVDRDEGGVTFNVQVLDQAALGRRAFPNQKEASKSSLQVRVSAGLAAIREVFTQAQGQPDDQLPPRVRDLLGDIRLSDSSLAQVTPAELLAALPKPGQRGPRSKKNLTQQ